MAVVFSPAVIQNPIATQTITGQILKFVSAPISLDGASPVTLVGGTVLQKAETGADTNVLTFTPAATSGLYEVFFGLSLSAANTATIGWTATYKDSNSNAQTPTNVSLFQLGTAAPALTFTTSAAGDYYGFLIIDVDNSSTNIVIKLTFSGTSFSGKVSAAISRLI